MFRTLVRTAFLLLVGASVHATDVEVSSRLDNLYWSPARIADTAGYTFQGSDLFWNLQGSVTQELNDSLTAQGGLEIDPVLRWRAYTRLTMGLENLSVSFAPFLGLFNSEQKWFNPGLEAQVEYSLPGVLFVGGGFLTTFAPVAKSGDYYLSAQNLRVGALMENGIVTARIEDRSATFRKTDTLTTVDAATKYSLDTEMFLKHFPLKWALLVGYQITSRSYITATEVTTKLHSALIGGRLSWDFGGGTSVYLQGESAFFNVGWDSTVYAVPSSAGLYQLVAGTRYHW